MIWNEIIQNQVLQSITKIEVLNVDNTDLISADAYWIWTTVIYDIDIQFNITVALFWNICMFNYTRRNSLSYNWQYNPTNIMFPW